MIFNIELCRFAAISTYWELRIAKAGERFMTNGGGIALETGCATCTATAAHSYVMANRIRIMFPILFIFLLSGCYPINKTLQPHAEMTVVDESGNPVEDAIVTLIAGAYPYGEERTRMSIKTDYWGKTEFPKIKDWRIESLMIHGSEAYYWSWCVYKDGYATNEVGYGGSEGFTPKTRITLREGIAKPCPNILHEWQVTEKP